MIFNFVLLINLTHSSIQVVKFDQFTKIHLDLSELEILLLQWKKEDPPLSDVKFNQLLKVIKPELKREIGPNYISLRKKIPKSSLMVNL